MMKAGHKTFKTFSVVNINDIGSVFRSARFSGEIPPFFACSKLITRLSSGAGKVWNNHLPAEKERGESPSPAHFCRRKQGRVISQTKVPR
jgi:hypothetical protein